MYRTGTMWEPEALPGEFDGRAACLTSVCGRCCSACTGRGIGFSGPRQRRKALEHSAKLEGRVPEGLAGEGAALLTGRGDVLMRSGYSTLGSHHIQEIGRIYHCTSTLLARHSCAASSRACISSHSSSPSPSPTLLATLVNPSHDQTHQIPGPSQAAKQSISAEKCCFASRLVVGQAGGSQQSSNVNPWLDDAGSCLACYIRVRADLFITARLEISLRWPPRFVLVYITASCLADASRTAYTMGTVA